ncbi:MAG: dUTP diphosphatase [Chlamydiales bacterium]|nr:dUTP diphosphatase [Chlamydiales bacterium]NCF70199.1 dUTP diphosphatase [Chlamydiales bacterium]
MHTVHDEQTVEVFIQTKDNATTPVYQTKYSSGADVRAYLDENLIIPSGQSALIPTGLHFAIPTGFEIQVRPRSGLALREQVTVLNTPGTIDSDYRGELKVILINHGKKDFIVEPGMRIAQLVIAPVVQARFIHKEELSQTDRGEGGFGHTGTQ